MFTYRFGDPAALQFLWLVPLLGFLLWWMARRSRQVIESQVAPRLTGFLLRSLSPRRRKIKWTLQVLALAFFVLALARPQSGEGRQKAKSEGLEIMLVVDVSNSMMAEDVRPSRLEMAQRELSRFIDSLSGDKVGLVAFAGSAVLLSPLTGDKAALKMFLESLTTESVTTQGTDFKRAISEAHSALQRGGLEGDDTQAVTKVIIVASDGEETEKGGIEAAQKAANDGIRIFTLGFGTADGGQIPVFDGQNRMVGYKKDARGQAVVSRLTGEALTAIAEAGQGTYQVATFGGDSMRQLKGAIDRLQRAQFDSLEVSHYDEHYQLFLLIGLVLAGLELALGERRPEGRLWRGRFEVAQD